MIFPAALEANDGSQHDIACIAYRRHGDSPLERSNKRLCHDCGGCPAESVEVGWHNLAGVLI